MTTQTRRQFMALGISLGTLALGPAAPGQEPKPSRPAGEAKAKEQEKGKWVPLFERHAGEYKITVDGQGGAKRLPEPVLRWWQPVRGGDDGALYLWVDKGRPVAAITFFTFKWPDGNRAIVHERHSFAREPLEASWRESSVWRTSSPGLTFKPVPDAPAPAETPAARLRQMQAIVRDFSANTIDDKEATWPQRPLARPLYRYETSDPGLPDGALFAFAQGTDPEAFLLLEARSEAGPARWHYALARFTDLRLRVRHRNQEVFSAPNTIGSATEIYQSTVVLQKPSDAPADFE
jgi:hypothetical protein